MSKKRRESLRFLFGRIHIKLLVNAGKNGECGEFNTMMVLRRKTLSVIILKAVYR